MSGRSSILVEGSVWLRRIHLVNEERVLSLWLGVNREAAEGNARRARAFAREMLRELCDGLPRWLPAWKVRRLLPRALELAGLGQKDGTTTPEQQAERVETALSDFQRTVFWLASRLGVTERALLEGTRPASLNALYWSVQREEASESLARVKDAHFEPEARIRDLEATIKRLDEKIRKGSAPKGPPRPRNEKRWKFHQHSVERARPWAKGKRPKTDAA